MAVGRLPDKPEARPPGGGRASYGTGRTYRPAAFFSASTRSVFSQVNSGSSRPKWPYAAVRE
ncbi:hypothetical protein RKD46_007064 [Streptomyces pseudovenezuelae]